MTPVVTSQLDTLLQTMAAGGVIGALVGLTAPALIQGLRDRRAARRNAAVIAELNALIKHQGDTT
jgi:hypothetical protein